LVVDNDCPNRSADTVRDLPLTVVEMGRNAGFGAGSNAGAKAGSAPAILFLNPDGDMQPDQVLALAEAFERDAAVGAAGPHILETDGTTQLSMRRTPRLRSAFAEAFFLNNLLPGASWTSEIVADGYEQARDVEWLSGAVLAVRRSAFEEVGGFDERFFLYSEDVDLCTRLRRAGYRLRYDPRAIARHAGGGSAPRPGQVALKAGARITYARLHEPLPRYAAFRAAFVLNELMRLPLAATRSRGHLQGRLAALAVTLRHRQSAVVA
jgi:N-acetylglucosaminyl-diphospho-decaprenol L-rhamnosyltransferase